MKQKKQIEMEMQNNLEQSEESVSREKQLLWPILQALGVERKKWETFKYFPDQLVGLAISCIRERDRQISTLWKENHDLRKALNDFKQQSFDFRRCPTAGRTKI